MPRPYVPATGWLAYYRELVGTWRRRSRAHEDVEDALHDAVLRVLERDTLPMDDPRAYLRRSLRNGLIDRYRHDAVLPTVPLHDLDDRDHPTLAGPEADVHARHMARDLMAALDELPLVCQQVYIRHRLEGWSHADIAQAMGLSRAMVEKHMTRALQHLNRQLQKYAR